MQYLMTLSTVMSIFLISSCKKSEPSSYLVEYDQSQVVVKIISPPPGSDSKMLADQIGQSAIKYRKDLALEFIGKEVAPFPQRMPITATFGNGSGDTSYDIDSERLADPQNYVMNITGPTEDLLVNSTLKHEVMHTVTSTHVGGVSPRWLDEGMCSMIEQPEEVNKLRNLLGQSLSQKSRFIPFRDLLPMDEYPADALILYYEGAVIADYLTRRVDGGPKKTMRFIKRSVESVPVGEPVPLETWNKLLQEFYAIPNADTLESEVKAWFLAGSKNYFIGEESDQTSLNLEKTAAYIGDVSSTGKQFLILASASGSPMEVCIAKDANIKTCTNLKTQIFSKLALKSQGNFIFKTELSEPLAKGYNIIVKKTGTSQVRVLSIN